MNLVGQETGSGTAIEVVESQRALNPDPIQVAADLSHQLEEARTRIERLEKANREMGILVSRAESARDVLKELLMEAMRQ